MSRRLRVLVSAYACDPKRGSEPGVGWNAARALAERSDVWVLTMAEHRPTIEAELARDPVPGLRAVYWELPRWVPVTNRGPVGAQLHYYLWQIGAYAAARRLHREIEFDLVHHVTYVKYWMPSFMVLLPVPLVWGPVGGGESAPRAFWAGFGARGVAFEVCRTAARWLGEHDPFVRLTARRCAVALATTEQTAHRLRRLRARDVRLLSEVGLTRGELECLGQATDACAERPVRFISIGRLVHWKGFHLALRAFAQLRCPAEYWILGTGPEEGRLRALARDLSVADRVRLLGSMPRAEALMRLRECDVLVHPSLHDSGGWVCLEAMAAGRPVVCLDLGGPATQVTPMTGRVVAARRPRESVAALAAAMEQLAGSGALRAELGEAARAHAAHVYAWDRKANEIGALYEAVIGAARRAPRAHTLTAGAP